jgi:hypothetical protein
VLERKPEPGDLPRFQAQRHSGLMLLVPSRMRFRVKATLSFAAVGGR